MSKITSILQGQHIAEEDGHALALRVRKQSHAQVIIYRLPIEVLQATSLWQPRGPQRLLPQLSEDQ